MNDALSAEVEAVPRIDDWLEASEQALLEVALAALSAPDGHVLARAAESPSSMSGAYVSLISDEEVAHVGVCAKDERLRALAGGLLGPAESLSAADLTDAVGEIVNMLAGGVKRRLAESNPGLRIGLPMWVRGNLEATERQQLRASFMRLHGVGDLVLIVLHAPRSGRFDPTP
jgi:hypothetical protein